MRLHILKALCIQEGSYHLHPYISPPVLYIPEDLAPLPGAGLGGQQCSDLLAVSNYSAFVPTDMSNRPVCRHFMMKGNCRYENNCAFYHPGVNGPPLP